MTRKPFKYTAIIIFIVFALVSFISCPAAPPVDPVDEYNPNGAPAAPTGVKATNGYEGQITISWESVTNATSYQIWMIESSEYGTSSDIGQSTTPNELQKRGFKHVADVDSATLEYTLSVSGNKAYVFSVVAVRNMASEGSASNLVYSIPSEFVEGSTINQLSSITLTGIGSSREIRLYWDVPNIYSVLTEVKTPLYDYDFTVSYKRTSEDDTGWTIAEENYKDLNITLLQSEFGFDPDTYYDFRISMSIKDDSGNEINAPTSSIYPVLTDSNLTLQPMRSVSVTQGTVSDGVEVSWVFPAMPSGITANKAYQVERKTEDSQTWDIVLNGQDEYVINNPEKTSWKDTTAADNTEYTYRVRFGYMSNGAPLLQSDSDEITESDTLGWKLWRPEDIKAEMDGSGYSGTAKISWTYTDDSANVSWKLIRHTWDQENGTQEDQTFAINSGTYSYDDQLSIDSGYQTYTYTLIMVYNSEEIIVAENFPEEPLSLGTPVGSIISDLSASTDMVGVVRLSWTVSGENSDDGLTYAYYVDRINTPINITSVEKSGTNRYADIEVTDGQSHTYRLAINNTTTAESVTGNVLTAPEGFSASNGTLNDGIELSFTPKSNYSDNVELIVERQKDGTWETINSSNVTSNLKDGTATISDDIDDPSDYGTVYNFRIALRNMTQAEDKKTEYSAADSGNILGGAGIELTAEQYVKKDSFVINWANNYSPNDVGITGYKVYARVKDSGSEFIELTGTVLSSSTSNSYEYSAVVDGVEAQGYTYNPLSVMYEFKLVPINRNNDRANIESAPTAEGILFCPPADITATKAEYTDVVNVSWDAVDGAERYFVYRYSEDETPENAQLISDNCRTNSYPDTTTNGQEYFYTVKAVKTVDGQNYESLMQTGFETLAANMYKEVETANKGYILNVPKFTIVQTVHEGNNSDNPYESYVMVQWNRSHGATEYTLLNSIVSDSDEDTVIDVSELAYSDSVVSSGTEGEAGYLTYNPTTKLYTYYDGRGTRKDSLEINNYSISAGNDTANTIADNDGNSVTRALKPVEYVNLLNGVIQPILQAADEVVIETGIFTGGDKELHDWWLYALGEHSWTYPYEGNNNAIVYLHSDGYETSYKPQNNYLSLNNFESSIGMNLTTTTNLRFNVDAGQDSGGVDYLNVIGDSGYGTIEVTFKNESPYNGYIPATIKYENIYPRVSDYIDFNGYYYVTIDGSSEVEITDSDQIIRPFISQKQ